MRFALLALLLVGCNGDKLKPPPSNSGWSIGPIIGGTNYSKHCPASFSGSFQIGPCEPHYVTKSGNKIPASLTFTLDGDVAGLKCDPATISLHFETSYNDWQTDGGRWWSGTIPLTLGTHTITAGKWRSVHTMNEDTRPQEFAKAKANISRVGFTFGDCTGAGHGVKGSARFTVE